MLWNSDKFTSGVCLCMLVLPLAVCRLLPGQRVVRDNVDAKNTQEIDTDFQEPLEMSEPFSEEDADFAGLKRNNDGDRNGKQSGPPKPFELFDSPIERDIAVVGVKRNDDDDENDKQKGPPKPFEMKQRPIEEDIAIAGFDMTDRRQQANNFEKREENKFAWAKKHLTWRLYNFPSVHSPISPEQVVRDIETALSLWSSVTPLTFERHESGDVDMRIFFASKDHRDGYNFDGIRGVAGHAFAPGTGNPLDGDVHLDDDEVFTNEGKYGTNFLYVVTHEIGHALGLLHSTKSKSIMQGYVMPGLPYGPNKLPLSDARTIQGLYGKKPGMGELPTDPPTVPPTTPPPFDCKGGDYAATVVRGSLFLLQNDKYWRFEGSSLDSELITPSYGSHIGPYFKDLPDGVESAFTLFNGTTVYTKGRVWYSYNMKRPGGQQDADPGHIDAAYHDERRAITYFFQGNFMKKFNHRAKEMSSWVLASTEFEGFPGDISAAFTDEQEARYIMKNDKYWKYNRKSTTPDRGFPQPLPATIC